MSCPFWTSITGMTEYCQSTPFSWNQTTVPIAATWYAGAYGNGLYCVAGLNKVIVTPDGLSWAMADAPWGLNYDVPTAMASNGTKFVVVINGIKDVYTSIDGLTWSINVNAMPFQNVNDIASNGEIFCAVGRSSAATSTDGATWTQRTLPLLSNPLYEYWKKIIWNGTVFCALSNTNIAATSPDGVVWTQITLPRSLNFYITAAASNGTIVVMIGDGFGIPIVSTDNCATWSYYGAFGWAHPIAGNANGFCIAQGYGYQKSKNGKDWSGDVYPYDFLADNAIAIAGSDSFLLVNSWDTTALISTGTI